MVEMPELVESHRIRLLEGHELHPKVDFEWLWGILTTYRATLEEWKNDTTIDELEEENKHLAMDAKVYKRKYEEEIAKCRELTAELKTLKASSMSAPLVPVIRSSSVSGTPLPVSSVGVSRISRIPSTKLGTNLRSSVGGYGGSSYSKGFDPILGGYPRKDGNLTWTKVEEVIRFLESWKTVHALLEAPHSSGARYLLCGSSKEGDPACCCGIL